MNYFKLFSVLQGIAIVVLCVAVFQLTAQIEQFSSNQNNLITPIMSDLDGGAKSSAINKDDLRIVIREEFQTHLINQAQPNEQLEALNGAENESVAIQASKPLAIQTVGESIEYHISMGSISEGDMGKLEMEIAKLDPSNRTAMLSKLVQAMNDGRLNGRL